MDKSVDIYLDTCCYSRAHDDHAVARNRDEYNAVLEIIRRRRIAGHILLGGWAVIEEIDKNRDLVERYMDTRFFWETIDRFIERADVDDIRAQELQAEGLGEMDSYHLATAEREGAGALITVDDDFGKIVTSKCLSRVVVLNPSYFI